MKLLEKMPTDLFISLEYIRKIAFCLYFNFGSTFCKQILFYSFTRKSKVSLDWPGIQFKRYSLGKLILICICRYIRDFGKILHGILVSNGLEVEVFNMKKTQMRCLKKRVFFHSIHAHFEFNLRQTLFNINIGH